MKKSEKLLAGAVGIMLMLGAITYGFLDFLDQYESNSKRLKTLGKRVQDEKYKMQLAFQASDRQGLFYEPISFGTAKTEITVYQDWLERTIRDSGLKKIDITAPKTEKLNFTSENRTLYELGKKHKISFSGQSTLNEILDFIYRFEEIDLLHRITA